ncbi:MAG: hypothetical protein NWT00_07175 [Beijerinckiaceae bacterium]|jgi:hypothetical protein|nr:hypothetical protein [Beijerinckiaceae bacterium]
MRLALLLAGVLFILFGAITLPTPLPLGIPCLVIGCALVLTASPGSRIRFKRWRENHPKTSAIILKFEPKLPHWLQQAIRETRPGSG